MGRLADRASRAACSTFSSSPGLAVEVQSRQSPQPRGAWAWPPQASPHLSPAGSVPRSGTPRSGGRAVCWTGPGRCPPCSARSPSSQRPAAAPPCGDTSPVGPMGPLHQGRNRAVEVDSPQGLLFHGRHDLRLDVDIQVELQGEALLAGVLWGISCSPMAQCWAPSRPNWAAAQPLHPAEPTGRGTVPYIRVSAPSLLLGQLQRRALPVPAGTARAG